MKGIFREKSWLTLILQGYAQSSALDQTRRIVGTTLSGSLDTVRLVKQPLRSIQFDGTGRALETRVQNDFTLKTYAWA